KKPIHWPSGEKNGLSPPSVPGIGVLSNSSIPRRKICLWLPFPATYATWRPSRDMASAVTSTASASPGGGAITRRAVDPEIDVAVEGPGLRFQPAKPATAAVMITAETHRTAVHPRL